MVRDTLNRRSRTRREATGKTIRINERDLLWMQKLHEHGALKTSHLLAFSQHLGKNEARAKNRLTDLFHETADGEAEPYLTRPAQQFQTIDARYNELVYDLSPSGKRLLKKHDRWQEPQARSPGPWWHGHMVACITADIEIETVKRDDLNYIVGYRVLQRAETTLRYPTTFNDPVTGRTVTKDLIPDALFGLEYITDDGPRYRFFVVEADRGTEPLTSSDINRKSFRRTLLQYEEYVGRGRYKEHLKLTAPMVVLYVVSSEERRKTLCKLMQQFGAKQMRGKAHFCSLDETPGSRMIGLQSPM